MIRYRFIDEKYERPYSWITIPITVGGKIKAYFVVVEATELIDYFDQFALRIGFLLIQSLYEQILVAQSMEDMEFEKFLKDLWENRLMDPELIKLRAEELGIFPAEEYLMVIMEGQGDTDFSEEDRETVKTAAANVLGPIEGRIAPLNHRQWGILVPINQQRALAENLNYIGEVLGKYRERLQGKIKEGDFSFGLVDIPCKVTELKRNLNRGKQTLKVGPMIEEKNIHIYSDLGVFAWMDIQQDEFGVMQKDIKALLTHDSGEELLETLKVYLGCKMNYSLAAKQLYIHINTVRKRMETITDLISFDLEEPMNRLKLEMLLRLL